jgi:hypothetical protein
MNNNPYEFFKEWFYQTDQKEPDKTVLKVDDVANELIKFMEVLAMSAYVEGYTKAVREVYGEQEVQHES